MTRAWLVALVFGSALVGGIAGASVARLVAPPVHRGDPTTSAPGAVAKVDRPELDDEDDLATRLDALESALRSLQRREQAQLRASAPSSGPNTARPAETKSLVDDPVFEAAVTDVLQRVAEQQASERQAQRDERQQQRMDRWATELSARLALTPEQRATLVQLRTSMQAEMQGAFEADAGAALSREQRRARAREIEAAAEAKLSAALSARQLAEYQKLDPELKLSRGSRGRPDPDTTGR